MQTAIAHTISNWLQQHPAVLRLLEILIWMSNHPIISTAIVLFAIALVWQAVKGLGYLIEIGVRSLMQAPIKLLQLLFGLGAKSLSAVGGLALKQLTGTKNTELPALPPASSQPILPDKKERLAEISSRLEALQKEQNELLQEVAAIMASEAHQSLEQTIPVGKII